MSESTIERNGDGSADPEPDSSFRRGLNAGLGESAVHDKRTFVQRVVIPNAGGFVGLALLPLIALGLPWQAWALAFGAWIVNRIGHYMTLGAVNGLSETMAVGVAGIGMMLRVWFIAGCFLLVGAEIDLGTWTLGLGHPDWAVASMLIFMLLFTVDLAVRILREARHRSTTATAPVSPQEPTA